MTTPGNWTLKMGSKSQRRKERHAQKRKEKRKRQQQSQIEQKVFRHDDIPVPSNARHRQRLAEQVPRAWTGELPEDVAVFDDAALSGLPPELTGQVAAVRDALNDALASRGDEALKRLSDIPRVSSMSEWRLFIRGLIDWLGGAAATAVETWRRLTPDRRPGRIAAVMLLALRSDLESVTAGANSEGQANQSTESHSTLDVGFDEQQIQHAKFLRRVRFDRPAFRIAESAVTSPEEDRELLLGPRKIRWLKRFIEEYGDAEPELTAALSQAALGRAVHQKYIDLFNEAVKSLPGPRHDRRNSLLRFFCHSRFGERDSADKALNEYLTRDLPQNTLISQPLRNAIASLIHLNEATAMIHANSKQSFFDRFLGTNPDPRPIRQHLKASIDSAPENDQAYRTYASWIKSQLEEDRLRKPQRESLEQELADVMQRWANGIPFAVEPRLWLVDFLLENEQLDEARPHVEFLSGSRLEDPRVRAIPWKWQLLQAMQLCRRKAWLPEVPKRLDEAESLWPSWLPKDWLPYLRAAWLLRSRKNDEYEQLRRRICEESGRVRDSLADSCMMLGAAQQFRGTPAELKPLRDAVAAAVKTLPSIPLPDLIETAAFFWDLHRVQLIYPAYRSQGKPIGLAFLKRLEKSAKSIPELIRGDQFQKAVLWGSEHRFWASSYHAKLPPFFSLKPVERLPIFVAARLNARLKERYGWLLRDLEKDAEIVREAAPSQRDAYYRFWFDHLGDQYDEAMEEYSSRFAGFPFDEIFGGGKDDDDDDYDFEDLDDL